MMRPIQLCALSLILGCCGCVQDEQRIATLQTKVNALDSELKDTKKNWTAFQTTWQFRNLPKTPTVSPI
jgi:hypothetical protein